jgi:NADPH2:quinone reductase
MRAIVSSADGPVLRDIPRPSPRPEEVLVQVKAGSLNRADLAMLKGSSHGRVGGMGTPLGLEWAGEVVEVGDRVKRWRVGDRVMAAGGGAFAEYAVGHARRIYPLPNDLPFEQAAALPVALQTMHDAIATNGMLEAGQSVLIQGASSGVGLMGLQVARYLRAGLVIGTSTSPQRRERLREFGANLAIDTRAGLGGAGAGGDGRQGGRPADRSARRAADQWKSCGDADRRPHRQCRPHGRRDR